jgi:hypothetical protein
MPQSRPREFAGPDEALKWAFEQAFDPGSWSADKIDRGVSPAVVMGLLILLCPDDAELGAVVRWAFCEAPKGRPPPASRLVRVPMAKLAEELLAHQALPPRVAAAWSRRADWSQGGADG